MKHVGRLAFEYRPLGGCLLAVGLASVIALIASVDRRWRRMRKHTSPRNSRQMEQRLIALAVLGSNHVMIMTSRGLYTPFIAWFMYSMPVLLSLAGLGPVPATACFLLNELLFRNFGSPLVELWASAGLHAIHLTALAAILVGVRGSSHSASRFDKELRGK